MSLVDRLRQAREFQIEAGGRRFTARRPTDAEAIRLSGGEGSALDLVTRFTVGWEMTEIDLGVPGGTGAAVPFDAALWSEWIADQPELWGPLSTAILESYTRHARAREDRAKN